MTVARKIKFSTDTQREWDRHKQASDYIHDRFLMGDPRGQRLAGQSSANNVTIWNDSGDDRRFGEILEIDDLKTDDLDDRLLWLIGTTPTMANMFGVLLDPIVADEPGEMQLVGPCVALVNIIDVAHKFASPKKDSHVLQSCVAGPVRILSNPSDDDGEQTCAVYLSGDATQLVKPVSTITKGQPGNCKVWLNGADTGATVNLLALGAEVTGGKYATQWGGIVLPYECE